MPEMFMLEVDENSAKDIARWFQKLGNIPTTAIPQVLIDCAVILEGSIKNQLRQMVYSTKETNYKRTRKLYNATVAEGKTVVMMEPNTVIVTGNPKVERKGTVYTTGVRSHVKYAAVVHNGWGSNRRYGPRPYMTQGAQDAIPMLNERISKVVRSNLK